MLSKTCLVVGALFILGAYADRSRFHYDPFLTESHFDPSSYSPSFNWRAHYRSDEDLDSAESREPLSPDYKDPKKSSKPGTSYDSSVLPAGVLTVDAADGFANPASIPGLAASFGSADFGFGFGSNGGFRKPNGGFLGFGNFFGSSFDVPQPWWKGSNVCIEREESTDDDDDDDAIENQKNDTEEVPNFFSTAISLSNCQQTPTKYECVTKINNHGVVKTFTVRYKCCYGFVRGDGGSGCNKQLELKQLAETIEQLEGKSFMEMVSMVGMRDELDNGNFTVFMPTNQAIEEFDDKMNDMNQVEASRRRRDAVSTPELVRNHFVSGFVDLNDLSNEELITTENNNRTIRINVYPTRTFEKMVTANCIRISKSNNLAKNGIVHVLDGVMHPAINSIPAIVEEHPKLTSFRKVLENTDLESLFKDDGHYTLFAPTDEAFDKLDPATREKLINGKGCAASILRHHIVGNTICSAAIIGNATTHNVAGELLEMERRDDNKLVIESKANIEKHDIIATNGVIHLVDTVMIPDTALYLNDALKNNNMTKFQKLIEEAEFEEEMNGFENATVFAPSDAAFDTPEGKKYLEELEGDKEKIRDFIKAHVIDGKLETCEMENNAFLDTLVEDQRLRVNLYSTLPLFANIVNRATVNCARLTNFDEKSCGSIIHEVDRFLTPVNQSIMEIIENDDNYSTLRKIMQDTELVEILKDTKRSISFVAPDNEAFKSVNEEDMKTLLEDKEKANMVLKNHVLTEVLCCSGVGPQTFGFNTVVPTMAGQHQQVSRSGSRQIRIGRASVTKCDGMATNGVVHTANRVLFPQRPHHPQLGFFLFDF